MERKKELFDAFYADRDKGKSLIAARTFRRNVPQPDANQVRYRILFENKVSETASAGYGPDFCHTIDSTMANINRVEPSVVFKKIQLLMEVTSAF